LIYGTGGAIHGADTTDIRLEKQLWRVSQNGNPATEGMIAEDGSLVSLRFLKPNEIYGLMPNPHRPDFLKKGLGMPHVSPLGGSRGLFFWQNEAVPLPDVQKLDAHTILAKSESASLLYDFSHDNKIQLTASNTSDAPMQLLMVLDSTVSAVQSEDSAPLLTPVIRTWPETIWYQESDNATWKIKITGGDRIWGPAEEVATPWREGLYQVWEANLQAGETRLITIQSSALSSEQAATIKALIPEPIPARKSSEIAFPIKPQANDATLVVYSPKEHQVFQRATESHGKLRIAGAVRSYCDSVEARINGQSRFGAVPDQWQALPLDNLTHTYAANLKVPAGGWYHVDIRVRANGQTIAETTIHYVGIGEVFVTCGQSNSTNYGSTGPVRNKTETGLVASFGGGSWQLCEDPLPGSSDGSQGGSPWTFFGDAMVRKYQVPVAIAITGHGGAPVQYWTPGKFPFLWMMARINQLGPNGFRALLWHQGESSVNKSSEYYYDTLKEIIEASRQVAGWDIPWMVAQVSYRSPKEPSFDTTRSAQQKLWTDGIALPGPDTDTLIGEDRTGIHLSLSGLKKHGEMWAECVGAYLDPTFKQQE
jgi:hypothetical protein